MRKIPRIILLIETSTGWGRQFLRGISRYSRINGPWMFYSEPGSKKQPLPRLLKDWNPNGIISHIESNKKATDLINTNIPAVVKGDTNTLFELSKSNKKTITGGRWYQRLKKVSYSTP